MSGAMHDHREFVAGCFRCDLSRDEVKKCGGCYQNWRGNWWCDNCDSWPCICTDEGEERE